MGEMYLVGRVEGGLKKDMTRQLYNYNCLPNLRFLLRRTVFKKSVLNWKKDTVCYQATGEKYLGMGRHIILYEGQTRRKPAWQ